MPTSAIPTRPRTLSIDEAGEMLGISRWLAYEQAKTGAIAGVPIIKVGRRLLVPRAALERVVNGEIATEEVRRHDST